MSDPATEWARRLAEAEKAWCAEIGEAAYQRQRDLTDPRFLERLNIRALRDCGQGRIADALARGSGRLLAGEMTRAGAIEALSSHSDPILQHAATLIPKTRKARNPSKRAQSENFSGWELAQFVRAEVLTGYSQKQAFERVSEAFGFEPDYVKKAFFQYRN